MRISTNPRRGGFTLIELLTVISIIAVLLALSAGTFFRIRARMQQSASEAVVTKVNMALESRVSSTRDDAKKIMDTKNPISTMALASAGGDRETATTLLMYAKFKNELPMSFAEAKSTTVIGNPSDLTKCIILQPRTHFATLGTGDGSPEEAAACLFLALSEGGTDGNKGEGLDSNKTTVTINGQQYPAYADSWGKPISFVRHCYAAEVQGSPHVKGAAFDPMNPGRNPGVTPKVAAVWGQIVTNVPAFAEMPPNYNAGLNHMPTVVSSGQNRKWIDIGSSLFATESDNLFGYRLRTGGGNQ